MPARGPRRSRSANPLAAKKPHFAPKAKSVIFLFMVGGPRQIDLFDPKPELEKWHGKPLPGEPRHGRRASSPRATPTCSPAPASSSKHGKSGHVGQRPDAAPRRVRRRHLLPARRAGVPRPIHAPAMYELHTGRTLMGHPSLGSWVTYGLGSVEREPAGVLRDAAAGGRPRGRRPVLGRGLPAGRLPGDAVPQGAQSRS